MKTLRPTVTFRGQKYVDEEIRAEITRANPVALLAAQMLGRPVSRIDEVVGHERIFWNWVKPGPDGMVPVSRRKGRP